MSYTDGEDTRGSQSGAACCWFCGGTATILGRWALTISWIVRRETTSERDIDTGAMTGAVLDDVVQIEILGRDVVDAGRKRGRRTVACS